MPTTVGSLSEELAAELGEQYSDYDVGRQFRLWVSEVIQTVYIAATWPFQTGQFTLSTAAGQRTYPLLESSGDIKFIQKWSDTRTLDYKPASFIVKLGYDLEQLGEPVLFYYDSVDEFSGARVLGLWPVPDVQYDYRVSWEVLTPPGDDEQAVVQLTPEFLPLVKDGVRARYHEQSGNTAAAGAANDRFSGLLLALRKKYVLPRARQFVMRETDLPPAVGFDMPRLPPGY
jgi:hypothetical protein